MNGGGGGGRCECALGASSLNGCGGVAAVVLEGWMQKKNQQQPKNDRVSGHAGCKSRESVDIFSANPCRHVMLVVISAPPTRTLSFSSPNHTHWYALVVDSFLSRPWTWANMADRTNARQGFLCAFRHVLFSVRILKKSLLLKFLFYLHVFHFGRSIFFLSLYF